MSCICNRTVDALNFAPCDCLPLRHGAGAETAAHSTDSLVYSLSLQTTASSVSFQLNFRFGIERHPYTKSHIDQIPCV